MTHVSLVLVVDDFDDARDIYCECLRQAGYRTAQASNGVEAVERAIALGPDVVLLDLAMPVMDGIEAARRLRDHPRTKRVPIIALTGYSVPGYLDNARKAGCSAVLVKPVLPEDLLSEIEKLLDRS